MMNLDDYLKTIPDKEYIGCKIKVNDKFDIEDVRLDPKYSYLHMPFGKLQKTLLLCILSRPNPLFTELRKTYDFLSLILDTELIQMESCEEIQEENIMLYYCAVAQLRDEMRNTVGREYGYNIILPSKSLSYHIDKAGNVTEMHYGIINTRIEPLIEDFIDYLDMMRESIRVKCYMQRKDYKISRKIIKECGIQDPLNIGVW